MAKHIVSPIIPPLIDDERFNSNGMVPSASLMKRLADTFNFVSGKCKKQVFLKCQALDNVAAGDPANVIWPGYFRTGENTTGLRLAMGVALTDYGFSSAPYVQLVIRDTSPAVVSITPDTWKFSASSAGTTVTPNELNHIHAVVEGLSPNTEYTWTFECANGARPVYASMTECDKVHANDAVTAVCSPGYYMAEGKIYDGHIADLVEANNELWQHNGAHLISWCPEFDEDAGPVTVATTYTNWIDLTTTSVGAGLPGWNLFTQYHNTVNRTTVPVKFAVKTDRIAGAGTLSVQLTDGTNTITITGIADVNGWSTTTANIPAQAGTKWTLFSKVSSGGTQHRIMGIALFEYEA